MGNKPSFMLQDEEIYLISEETGFSPAQIERLYSRFTALDKDGNGSLSRQDCLAIPELAINPLCDRIVQMFFIDCDDDHDRINFRQFMRVLSTFLSASASLRKQSTISRQESLGRKQKQSLCYQAPLLFDSIDPTPFSHHSSFHDGYHHHHQEHPHSTTNQHSVHYASSSSHLPSLANGWIHHHHHASFNNNNNSGSTQTIHESNSTTSVNGSATNGGLLHKKPSFVKAPILDPEEPLNSKKHKLYFMFKIYDINSDDLIDLEDLIGILKMMVGTYVDDTRVRRIAERTLREADKNCDGYIDFDEFCSSFTRKDAVESLKVKFPNS